MGFVQTILRARADEFEWKTSDWIIQEVGVARGRGMDLILLVERGVRQPGGLQGNVEYIAFDRDAPERSFGKIIEMIAALSPKPSSSANVEERSAPLPTEEEEGTRAAEGDKWTTPLPTWRRRDYEFAYLHATALDESALAQRLSDAFLETEAAAAEDSKASWRAYENYVRLAFGKGGSLQEIKEAAKRFPENSSVLDYLGRAYEHYKQYSDAGDAYRAAAEKAKDVSVQLRLLREAAGAYRRAGSADRAEVVLTSMRGVTRKDTADEKEILLAQRELAEEAENDELVLAALERTADLFPDDEDSRFSLAYKHSERGNEQLALYHYLRIPEQERKNVTWNNLGVAFERLALPAKSVAAYRRAEELGNTLAMSNLAYRLMNAGFLTEAKAICDRALATREFHKNVGSAATRLMEIPEEESAKEDDLLKKARRLSDFYRDLGRAAVRPESASLSGRWKGPRCTLEVSLSNSTLRCIGEYEVKGGGGLILAALRGRAGTTREDEGPWRYRIEYEAKASGQAFVGTVSDKRVDVPPEKPSILGAASQDTKVLLALSDDGQEILVMERKGTEDARLYKLTRVSD